MLFVLLASLLTFFSWAHQSSLTSGGNELFWSNPNVPVAIRTNTSDLSPSTTFSIIQNSIAQWNASSSARVSSVSSSINEIKFISNYPYGSGVIGITEISYNTSGAIQKAVISLNDDFDFQSQAGLYPTGQVFLGDVVTHELGHLFGLSHSEVLNSTMFYSSFSGQNSVSLDDKSGMRQKYDSQYGTISGHMKGGNNIGVLGAHVQAISRKTGEASGAISDENGYFELGGLDLNDTYYLYSSPIKNPDSLPGYFSNVQDEFCPSAYVGSFFNACGRENDGKPEGITLTDNLTSVDVGSITINCSLKSDEAYSVQKLLTTFTPVTVYDYAVDAKPEKAFVGWFIKPTTTDWTDYDVLKIDLSAYANVVASTKYLKIGLVSFPFGSQLEYEMIVKKNGVTVATTSKVYSVLTETYQTDFNSVVALSTNPSLNTFEVSIRAKKLSSSLIAQTFPSASIFTNDQHLPYLLVTSLMEGTGGATPILDSGAILSDNQSCLDAPFTYAVAKALDVEDNSSLSSNQAAAATGCGTIEPPDDGPGSSMPLMALGFLLTLLGSSFFNSRKKFLS